jgi:hypothetical protein
VHAVFGGKDGRINELVLSGEAPAREEMAALYLVLKQIQAEEGEGFEVTNAAVAERIAARKSGSSLNERAVSSAIGVLRELELVRSEGHGAMRRLTVPPRPEQNVDLESSVRYAEGLEQIARFADFKVWVLGATAEELLHSFNRPILPEA